MAMITSAMNAKLSEQVTNELFASHAYLAMSWAFENMGLKVMAARFKQQSDEERMHALKIAKYLHDVGGEPKLDAIPKPAADLSTPEKIVQAALDSEHRVTAQINQIVALAQSENDYTSRNFLEWFVNEQVEEVASMNELLQLVRMAGDKNMLLVEARLAQTMGEKEEEE